MYVQRITPRHHWLCTGTDRLDEVFYQSLVPVMRKIHRIRTTTAPSIFAKHFPSAVTKGKTQLCSRQTGCALRTRDDNTFGASGILCGGRDQRTDRAVGETQACRDEIFALHGVYCGCRRHSGDLFDGTCQGQHQIE